MNPDNFMTKTEDITNKSTVVGIRVARHTVQALGKEPFYSGLFKAYLTTPYYEKLKQQLDNQEPTDVAGVEIIHKPELKVSVLETSDYHYEPIVEYQQQ